MEIPIHRRPRTHMPVRSRFLKFEFHSIWILQDLDSTCTGTFCSPILSCTCTAEATLPGFSIAGTVTPAVRILGGCTRSNKPHFSVTPVATSDLFLEPADRASQISDE
eukprot:SAG11_NODE_1193_length_5551_cov_2.289252_7_plen_108_part_00